MTAPLNIDLGELPGEPTELYALAAIANVACGGHAGDDATMARAVAAVAAAGARLSAHPSYPDRAHFGRARMSIGTEALRDSIAAQCRALRSAAARQGVHVAVVKPHGALYHECARDRATADAVLEAAQSTLGAELSVIGPPAGALFDAARARGFAYLREGFADRAYLRTPGQSEEDALRLGRLVARTEPGSVLDDPEACAAQALRLAASGFVETICVHGDGPRAVDVARAVRRALEMTSERR